MATIKRRSATAVFLLASTLSLGAAVPAVASAAGRISTVAGNGALSILNHPRGMAALPDGSVLIADAFGHRVRRLFPNGSMTTVAGTDALGYSGDGGASTSAKLNLPHAVAPLPDGSFLIADTNNFRIRKVSPSGIITTVAGLGIRAFSGDGGPAVAARISAPRGLAAFPDGSYLIADSDNNRVRRVSTTGVISTVAGTGTSSFGGDGGPAKSAGMNSPFGVAPLADGGFLVADADNRRVRQVSAAGTIRTVAGTGVGGFSGDGGPATGARVGSPYNISPLAGGAFLIADPENNRVRKVSAGGTISTVAGNGQAGFSGDGGSATSARLSQPKATLPFGSGFLIADSENHRVRRVSGSCTDSSSPVSYFTGGARRSGGKLKLRGRASDRGCAGVAKVAISIARVEGGGHCRNVGASGRLSKATSCSKKKFLKAKLRRGRWSYTTRRGLAKGKYVAQVRSADRSRNLERRKKAHGRKHNLTRFRLG